MSSDQGRNAGLLFGGQLNANDLISSPIITNSRLFVQPSHSICVMTLVNNIRRENTFRFGYTNGGTRAPVYTHHQTLHTFKTYTNTPIYYKYVSTYNVKGILMLYIDTTHQTVTTARAWLAPDGSQETILVQE